MAKIIQLKERGILVDNLHQAIQRGIEKITRRRKRHTEKGDISGEPSS